MSSPRPPTPLIQFPQQHQDHKPGDEVACLLPGVGARGVGPGRAGHGTGTVRVVGGAPRRVAQHTVRLVDFLHPRRGVGAWVHVGVVFGRQPPVGRFYDFRLGVRVHLQDGVVVGFLAHAASIAGRGWPDKPSRWGNPSANSANVREFAPTFNPRAGPTACVSLPRPCGAGPPRLSSGCPTARRGCTWSRRGTRPPPGSRSWR